MKFAGVALFLLVALAVVPKVTEALFACPLGACILEISAFISIVATYLGLGLGLGLAELGLVANLYYSIAVPIYLDYAKAATELGIDLAVAEVNFLEDLYDQMEKDFSDNASNWTDFRQTPISGSGSVYSIPTQDPAGRKLAKEDQIAISFELTGLPPNCDDCYFSVTEGGACVADVLDGEEGIWAKMNTTADGAASGVMVLGDTIDEKLAPMELLGATIVVGYGNGTALACAVLNATEAQDVSPTPAPTDSGSFSLGGVGLIVSCAVAVATSLWMLA